MNKSIFVPSPFFYVRSPIGSIDEYRHLFNQKNWKEVLFQKFQEDETFREAIEIASPGLSRFITTDSLALMNYFIRMTTRATPFGAFSFVSMGSWDEKAILSFENEKVRRKSRPCMLWISEYIEKFYTKAPLLSDLPVKKNPFIEFLGSKIECSFLHSRENIKKKNHSLRSTPLIRLVISLCEKLIGIGDLYREVKLRLPDLEESKFYELVQKLLSLQFLLPALRPSLLKTTPFQWGQNELSVPKESLQVDSFYPEAGFKLPTIVKDELVRSLDLLWKLSNGVVRENKLKDFHKKFLERYGTSRRVPLLELIKSEQKIFHTNKAVEETPFQKTWEKWLFQEWQIAILEKKDIQISEDLIQKLYEISKTTPPSENTAIPSCDIFCQLEASSEEMIDSGKFLLYINQISPGATRSIGRFLYLFDDFVTDEMKNLLKREEALEKDALFVESSYWPESIKAANVAIHPPLRSRQMDLEESSSSPNSIGLLDLYVGANRDRLYITLKDEDVEVIVTSGSMLTSSADPLVLQFVKEVGNGRWQGIFPFSWGKLETKTVFLPRVCFNRTVLSPARWRLDGAFFEKGNDLQILDQFISWSKKWNLPNPFVFSQGDRNLLLLLDNSEHLKEIVKEIKKGKIVQFKEPISQSVVTSKYGTHLAEFVIPCLRNDNYKSHKKVIYSKPYSPFNLEDRVKMPFTEWVYIKLYLSEQLIDECLAIHILPFISSIYEKIPITNWHFLRYADPDSHIRLRIQVPHTEKSLEVLEAVLKKAKEWLKNKVIETYLFASYEREIERYGGIECISIAEEIFSMNSWSSLKLLEAMYMKKITKEKSIFFALSVLLFLDGFPLSIEEKIKVLDLSGNDTSQLNGFRAVKSELINTYLSTEEIGIKQIMQFSEISQKVFASKIENQSKENIYSAYLSLLHMHCNRMGCSKDLELQAYLYAKHTLKAISYLRIGGSLQV